ncbi:hypothetical protein [Frankia nepalensis]|nr:hypothetical protein [Frankia nepalensis]
MAEGIPELRLFARLHVDLLRVASARCHDARCHDTRCHDIR